jgi:hypothetical protein
VVELFKEDVDVRFVEIKKAKDLQGYARRQALDASFTALIENCQMLGFRKLGQIGRKARSDCIPSNSNDSNYSLAIHYLEQITNELEQAYQKVDNHWKLKEFLKICAD